MGLGAPIHVKVQSKTQNIDYYTPVVLGVSITLDCYWKAPVVAPCGGSTWWPKVVQVGAVRYSTIQYVGYVLYSMYNRYTCTICTLQYVQYVQYVLYVQFVCM